MSRAAGHTVLLAILAALALLPGVADGRAARQATSDGMPQGVNTAETLRLAVEDLVATHGDAYPGGGAYLKRLSAIEARLADDPRDAKAQAELAALGAEALLANPALDFGRLLFVSRDARTLALPQNWQGNCAMRRSGYDDVLRVLSPVAPNGAVTTLYKPERDVFVGDVDLDFDVSRLLFSSTGTKGRWHVFEIRADGTGLRQVTPEAPADVDSYDACYLPDGRIVYGSTAVLQGVPCVGGRNQVANLHRMNPDGTGIRRLCFDQDHNWCPTVLADGRVGFTRWEYSDTPHYFTRIFFRMNPDGTGQMAAYGSNSYWPNSLFYVRPVPGHPSKVAGIVSGHHGVPRMGELVLFDVACGQHEADGTVQRIPGRGDPVRPVIRDGLVNGSWPKFLHPYPLTEKHLLVACQPHRSALWGLYLVDVFDNLVLLREEPGRALLEPMPFRPRPRPQVIPDKVDPERTDATVYLTDVYRGPGLAGVPRGSVKRLRLFAFHYAYHGMGGHIHIGIDGPWDVHRILGTVPVEADGSAVFRVPANTPIAVQPLDARGKALQVMRSWFTAMPGENLSCVGCHERTADVPPVTRTLALKRAPSEIEPWYGPARGLSFRRDVQPVLDAHCIRCHDGSKRADGKALPDLRVDGSGGQGQKGRFTPSYVALHPYVRRPGPESDYHVLRAAEYHADTSELVQMLRKGHHGVQLDAEGWDRIITWIDLNVPDHGTWSEHRAIRGTMHERRLATARQYANLHEDPEAIPDDLPPYETRGGAQGIHMAPAAGATAPVRCEGWPFDAAEAARRQVAMGETEMAVDLGPGPDGKPVALALVRVPAGAFVMGDAEGLADERPTARVAIERPFWIGRVEVTNAQFTRFDPEHTSGVISEFNKDQSRRGIPADGGGQPAIRISWDAAMAFCRWLSERTGREFTLPTEAQWEWACRAGTATDLAYGPVGTDFGRTANLADTRLNALTRRDSPNWIPTVDTVDDRGTVTAPVGRYEPNAWGLCDMHGNAAEWTRSAYRPYPYDPSDGRDAPAAGGRKVVRGGSFYDRPKRARSAMRLAYPPWQRVWNVGFRVVCEGEAPAVAP